MPGIRQAERRSVVIAKTKSSQKSSLRFCGSAVTILIALSLSSCTSSLDLFGGSKVDRSISTGTVPSAKHNETTVSDETTVRNAVSSIDIAKFNGSTVPWANTATGSAGVVSNIREARDQGNICRDFMTTRHSYEGIAMFSGRTCLTGSGDWMLTAFDRQ